MLRDTEAEGEMLALADELGLRLALTETLSEADGLTEALGDSEAETEDEALALGDSEAEALVEALGDSDGEALPPKLADTRLPSLLIGFQIAVNLIRPAVIVAEATVSLMSWATSFSLATEDNSIEASGVASCQMSPASISVPVA